MIYPRTFQTQADVAGHYDSLDPYYRSLWGIHLHHGLWRTGKETVQEATEHLVDVVATYAKISRNSKVLDVGCGYGAAALRLAGTLQADVTGITLSEKQWEYAIQQMPSSENPHYMLGDFLENSFESNGFDAVIAIESSEHMPSKSRLFSEICRVLKPGGHFVICSWLVKNSTSSWEEKYLLEPICYEGRLAGLGTEQDYRELIEGAGLELSGYEDLSSSVQKTWTICMKQAAKSIFFDSGFRKYLMNKASSDRKFIKTIIRIRLAYLTGSMRYGLFYGKKALIP
jgi:tocopherol O-methyltransferase